MQLLARQVKRRSKPEASAPVRVFDETRLRMASTLDTDVLQASVGLPKFANFLVRAAGRRPH